MFGICYISTKFVIADVKASLVFTVDMLCSFCAASLKEVSWDSWEVRSCDE